MTYREKLIIRKLIHLSTGLIIWMLSYVVEKNVLLYFILTGTGFSLLTFNFKKFHLLHKTTDASLGTIYYPFGILSSYLILCNLPLYYFQTSLLVLSISDTLAYFAGRIKKGNKWFRIFHDKKSVFGTLAYAVSAYLIFKIVLPPFLNSNYEFLVFAVLLAVILENATYKGSDNLTIPAGLSLIFYFSYYSEINYILLTFILLTMAFGSYFLFRFKILTREASFTAFVLGFYLAGILGWSWFLSVLLFFTSSTAFTILNHSKHDHGKQSVPRNTCQVIANIIWAVISSALFLYNSNEFFILFYIVFVSAVTADTWASELGPVFHKRSFSLATGRMEPSGVNGGISVIGSAGAFAGSIFISSTSYYLFFFHYNWSIIIILSISAFLSCFSDSFLGAFLENKLLKMDYFKRQKSIESVTPNDLINMAASFMACAYFILLYRIIH